MRKAQFPIRTSISLSADVYEQILVMSDDRKISLGEQIRELVDSGLENKSHKKEKENNDSHTN